MSAPWSPFFSSTLQVMVPTGYYMTRVTDSQNGLFITLDKGAGVEILGDNECLAALFVAVAEDHTVEGGNRCRIGWGH